MRYFFVYYTEEGMQDVLWVDLIRNQECWLRVKKWEVNNYYEQF